MNSRVLAIDYGLKRTGLAISDVLKITSNPIGTIDTKNIVSVLEKLFVENTIEIIVLGYPKDMFGNDTHNTLPVEKFYEFLQKKYPKTKIVLHDERLTSKIAKKTIFEMGIKKEKRKDKKLLDTISATLILQNYLQQI